MITAKATWKTGQAVKGQYCGQAFSGVLNDNTRPTPDYKNVIFCVSLNSPISVFGQPRERVEVWTNGNDSIEFCN